jgi:hypothetical protein
LLTDEQLLKAVLGSTYTVSLANRTPSRIHERTTAPTIITVASL